MKKVFTLILAMALVVTGFAQIKSSLKNQPKPVPAKISTFTGFEERDAADFPASTRSIVGVDGVTELSQTVYDWQSNMGARNYTAVWPDGFAVMCFTQSTNQTHTDRGTGLAIWDPAVGEWEYTESRVEGVKTGFGSISRYKENGLVVAAHCASDARIFIVEDFRQGNRDFGEGIALPVTTGVDPVWPSVQCSGENLDYINVLITNSGATIGDLGGEDPIIYYQYHEGEWTHQYETIPNLDVDHMTDGGSNITYFMLYNPEKPNRVAFILNNAWSDGKAVISEDNGATWSERVFYQHPGITLDYTDEWFFYPRWTSAAFDGNDNLHIAYEWNGTTGAPGSGSYYPGVGGVGYWSEILPKNEMCLGGIGEVGQPFIMDSTYLIQDFYGSEWWWSDANHDPLPENFGMLQILGPDHQVTPYDEDLPDDYIWFGDDITNLGDDMHGKYNNGVAGFASMYYDVNTNKVVVFWSMLAGEQGQWYWDENYNCFYFSIFCNYSTDGGATWEGVKHVIGFMPPAEQDIHIYDESVYGQVIPYLYNDEGGDYVWYVYQNDQDAGTFVQSDETVWDNNFYNAVKVYLSDMLTGVEENNVEVPTTMSVYPNPANGSFHMELNQEADVNVYNVAGQLVKTYKSVKSLNVNLEAGIYFVKAGNETQKVVVF